MDIMTYVDSAIEFGKDKLDKLGDFWESIDDDRKKLLIGCAIAAVSIVVIASIAYAIGKAHGKRIAFEEEEF
jgi:hypothetical protein